MDMDIVYRAANAPQAAILKNILQDEGIESHVTNIALQSIAGEIPLGWTSAPCVMVRSEDLERAREIAEQFERDISQQPEKGESCGSGSCGSGGCGSHGDGNPQSLVSLDQNQVKDAADSQADPGMGDDDDLNEDEIPTWRSCPECGAIRRGRCPSCKLLDGYFGRAEYVIVDRQTHSDGAFVSESFEVDTPKDHVMCTVCDKPVQAEPLRYCESCQHDFGHGWVEPIDVKEEASSSRVFVVIVVLAVLGLASAIYAWTLAS